jgi:hypothetical protein
MKSILHLSFLFCISFLLVSCTKQNAIIEAHNQLVKIESTLVDRYNSSSTLESQAKAVAYGIEQINRIGISECPTDYQDAWNDLINGWREWKRTLEKGDIEGADIINTNCYRKVIKLNRIAESHGVTIIGGR